jgi:hypothetical protein
MPEGEWPIVGATSVAATKSISAGRFVAKFKVLKITLLNFSFLKFVLDVIGRF